MSKMTVTADAKPMLNAFAINIVCRTKCISGQRRRNPQ